MGLIEFHERVYRSLRKRFDFFSCHEQPEDFIRSITACHAEGMSPEDAATRLAERWIKIGYCPDPALIQEAHRLGGEARAKLTAELGGPPEAQELDSGDWDTASWRQAQATRSEFREGYCWIAYHDAYANGVYGRPTAIQAALAH